MYLLSKYGVILSIRPVVFGSVRDCFPVRFFTSGVVMPILLLYAFGGTWPKGKQDALTMSLTWVETLAQLRIPCVLWGFFARASCLNILTCDSPWLWPVHDLFAMNCIVRVEFWHQQIRLETKVAWLGPEVSWKWLVSPGIWCLAGMKHQLCLPLSIWIMW